ncbi:hypothetical protein I4U23_011190 [Adineta vaga]|nr:hypothetical protein I4U23_011190 [Adineta vaga]
MKQRILSMLLILCVNQCISQKGFPTQFQTILNITGLQSWQTPTTGIQRLLYDYDNLRVRFDIRGWRLNQSEAYMLKYKPEGAEADSPASQGYTLFNFNPDHPELTKNDCWYRTDPMSSIGPLPWNWFYSSQGVIDSQDQTKIQPWFPLPANLINKGEEWIPEIKQNAIRYDSPEICDLEKSRIGKVPCLSYFEIEERPVKTIRARAAKGDFDSDEYITTVYLTFIHGFTVDPLHGFVVTPQGNDNFTLKLQTPPVHALGDQIKVEFKVQPNWYYNGTRCAQFNPIIFDKESWNKPQQVDMSFVDYGCCTYAIMANGGGYDWQYAIQTFVVYACDGQAGYGCKGKQPCGA